MTIIHIRLSDEEQAVLYAGAAKAFRAPRDHAKYLLMRALGSKPDAPPAPPKARKKAARSDYEATP